MNIREAIKSGKRFRRKPGNMWDPNFWYDALSEADIANRLCRPMWAYDDLVADDWEVEETSATITSSQFDLAWDRASYGASVEVSQYDEELFNRLYINALYSQLKKELGL